MASNVVSRVDLQPIASAAPAPGAATLGERLDLVGHVKVKVSVSLGGAEMTVAKLFSLSANEVIALDRSVDAPVDVKLNDKVIARGALVAVGDNFGVRISEILKE
jgi:flagellar motor switch protein FliN/FliY